MDNLTKVLLRVIISIPIVIIVFAVLLFVPANDFIWIEGWLFITIFVAYIVLYSIYYSIKDPDILIKRGKYTTDSPETKSFPDKSYYFVMVIVFLFVLLLPGIDRNLTLSPISIIPEIEILGFIGSIFSLFFITYVNQVNKYASKGLVIHKDHELITAGPYRFVRHPMYVGAIIMFFSIPIALGSFIAFIVSFLLPFFLIFRIRIEEEMLVNHLPGYKEYMDKVKYSLIPFLY
jgi:protein-S-isoprenylcysteine O-methyltransferase Ste14